MSIFSVVSLPAKEGDCLIVRYGVEDDLRHIVIDAGHTSTGRELTTWLRDAGIVELELLVVTHVDIDHIEGILNFLDNNPDLIINDIWFNGYKHLQEGLVPHGALQGEELTNRISARAWNKAFAGHAVRIADDGTLPGVTLAGGLELTLLSPDRSKLSKMVPHWERECARAGLIPGRGLPPLPVPQGLEALGGDIAGMAATVTKADTAPANGTSIAFLASYDGKTVLFGADAHPDILVESLAKIEGGPVELDLLKVPHHGSQANVTEKLIKAVRCSRFLISTNGSKFNHPDKSAIARLILGSNGPAQLHFNYVQEQTLFWRAWKIGTDGPQFTCHFVSEGDATLIPLLK